VRSSSVTVPADASCLGTHAVEIDTDKIDEAVLALLYLDAARPLQSVEGFRLGRDDRLHRKGMIYDPVGTAKSVVLTDEGLAERERLFKKLFAKLSASDQPAARSRR